MKLSARFSQIFALLVITLTLLTVSVFASSKSTANYGDPQGTSAHPHLSAANNIKGAATAFTPKPARSSRRTFTLLLTTDTRSGPTASTCPILCATRSPHRPDLGTSSEKPELSEKEIFKANDQRQDWKHLVGGRFWSIPGPSA